MSWKKNVFGNLIWAVYALCTAAALAGIAAAAVKDLGGSLRLAPAAAVLMAAAAAACALLLYRLPAPGRGDRQGGVSFFLVCEAVFAAAFLALGFFRRGDLAVGITDGGAYYEAAMVAEGKRIPFTGNGAEYVYLQLLHAVFLVLGNKLAVGIWLQVILQLLAVLILYFGVRRLAGVLPAMVMLVFFMCVEPVVKGALALSPEPLFLLLFACGFDMLAACRENGRGGGAYLTAGLWTGLTGYLDAAAFLLAPVGMAVVAEKREEKTAVRKRLGEATGFLTGIFLGFLFGGLLSSRLWHRPFPAVLRMWAGTYAPGARQGLADILENGLVWKGTLVVLLCFGVVGYWRHKERESLSGWVMTFFLAAAAWYTGIAAARVPVFLYLLFLLTVLAGVGVSSCLKTGVIPEKTAAETAAPIRKETESDDPGQAQYRPERFAPETEQPPENPPRFLENPLPLPKPHRKKVLDYDAQTKAEDDFDYPVDENDDFDIK